MMKLFRLKRFGHIELCPVKSVHDALSIISSNGGYVISVQGNVIKTEQFTYEVRYV